MLSGYLCLPTMHYLTGSSPRETRPTWHATTLLRQRCKFHLPVTSPAPFNRNKAMLALLVWGRKRLILRAPLLHFVKLKYCLFPVITRIIFKRQVYVNAVKGAILAWNISTSKWRNISRTFGFSCNTGRLYVHPKSEVSFTWSVMVVGVAAPLALVCVPLPCCTKPNPALLYSIASHLRKRYYHTGFDFFLLIKLHWLKCHQYHTI